MTRNRIIVLVLGALVAGCASPGDGLRDLDFSSMSDIMLNFAEPGESVNFFANALARNPDDPEARRNMAAALARAGRYEEAAGFYADVIDTGAATPQDRLTYADALLRTGNWEAAEAQLARVPESLRSYERARLAAVLADIRRDWAAADRHYQQARSLTIRPAPILNNWGVSKLSRGTYRDAEAKFREAVSFDRDLFAAKNNLVIARGRQKNYTLPIIPMNETERAQLLHDLAVVALDNGDTGVARRLLEEALATHPQHFEAAAVKLAGL